MIFGDVPLVIALVHKLGPSLHLVSSVSASYLHNSIREDEAFQFLDRALRAWGDGRTLGGCPAVPPSDTAVRRPNVDLGSGGDAMRDDNDAY